MPLYEYYCDSCDEVFEALRPLGESDQPAACPRCQREAARIMPTSFAPMSFKQGYAQRVPFHHRPVRPAPKKPRTIAPVKPKAARARTQRPERRREG